MAQATGPATGYRSVLRNRAYLTFLGMSTASGVGYSVFSISVVWLAYQLSGNLVVAGEVLFVETGIFSLTFLVGPLVDRTADKRTLFLVCLPVMSAGAFAIGQADAVGRLSVPILLGLVAAIAVLWDIVWAAENATNRLLLDQGELFAGQGLAGAIGGGNLVLGYATGGALIVLVGAGGGAFLYAALLAISSVFASALRIPRAAASGRSYWGDFRNGWRTIRASTGGVLGQLTVAQAIPGFLGAAPALMIALLAHQRFTDPARAYAVLFLALVLGQVGSGLVWGRVNPRGRVGGVMIGALAVTGVVALGLLRSGGDLVGAALVCTALGFSVSAYLGAKTVAVEGLVPPELLGRVTANLYLVPGVSGALGAIVLGDLGTWVLPPQFGLVVGLTYLAAGAVAVALPAIRRLSF